MDLTKFDQYIDADQKKTVDEQSDEKKQQMYREGVWQLSSAFNEFSQLYMKGMGLMMQGKKAVDPNYKKARDKIATAYERMDDAISKHRETLSKDLEAQYQEKMKANRR